MLYRHVLVWPMVVGVLGLLLAGCSGAGDSAADTTAVPNVTGMAYRDAQQRLAASSLRWRVEGSKLVRSEVRRDSVSTADDDTVIDQEPEAGAQLERKGIVTLKISCERPGPKRSTARCID